MAEDTNKTPAAPEPSIDDQLNAAAAGAVEDGPEPIDETPAEEAPPEPEKKEEGFQLVEGPAEELFPAEELDADGLPKGHKERSELGRKLSALHRRQDETQATLDRVTQLLEKVATTRAPETPAIEMPQLDPDEPVTFKEVEKILEAREQRKTQTQMNYNRGYIAAIESVVSEYIDDAGKPDQSEIDGVLEEMKSITYTPSSDPRFDAISNLRKAERAFLKKKMAQPKAKVNPLKGEAPRSALGTAPSGKVPLKAVTPIRLDKDAEAYLKYVSAADGAEKADKLRASMGRE